VYFTAISVGLRNARVGMKDEVGCFGVQSSIVYKIMTPRLKGQPIKRRTG
jgi:hypothetical protein